jgi:hypothetical protein
VFVESPYDHIYVVNMQVEVKFSRNSHDLTTTMKTTL